MSDVTTQVRSVVILPVASSSDADLALRRIANVIASRDATADDILAAMTEWARVVQEKRHQSVDTPAVATNASPSMSARIQDVVQLSPAALARQTS